MHDRRTPTRDLLVLCHFGIPRMRRENWSLRIDGLVGRPVTLGFDDLLRYPRTEVATVHQCCGSPFEPLLPTRRVGNVTWGGARLADILAECRPAAEARYVWSYGADSGQFGGVDGTYAKDLPLSRVPADVLICYQLNGESLPAEHGYPARLLVPGFYGTNSVKWLTRITLAAERADSPFTTIFYQDPAPVWAIAPESLLVAPAAGTSVVRGTETEIWGWAWADGGVCRVDIRIGDRSWRPARLEPPRGREWQRFGLSWTPARAGTVEVAARASSTSGISQPLSGRRNEVHRVSVTVH